MAYSLRKLRSAYAGSAIRVRRSSDNAEQDIGFSGSDFDSSALSSFVGANDGRVTTWYDQGTSGYNATNGTAATQPFVVQAGTLVAGPKSGTYGIRSTGTTNSVILTTQPRFVWAPFTHLAVSKVDASVAHQGCIVNNQTGTTKYIWRYNSDDKLYLYQLDSPMTTLVLDPSGKVWNVAQIWCAGAGNRNQGRINGGGDVNADGDTTTYGDTDQDTFIFQRQSTTDNLDGRVSELVCWGAVLSSGQRDTAQANVNYYYSIY